MKNFITILILSLAIIGCQAPNADPNGRTLIDPTDLIASYEDETIKNKIELNEKSNVLIFGCEGDTDQEMYQKLVNQK